MDLFYPLMERSRHPKAIEAVQEPPAAADLEGLRGARQALVVTFKRSGEPVPTPVNCAISEDGRVYFRSEPQMAKIKRIENNPRVLVGPCNIRGKPRGPLSEGRARILSAAENEPAYTLIRHNWSPALWPSEMAMDRLGVPVVYVEVCGEIPELAAIMTTATDNRVEVAVIGAGSAGLGVAAELGRRGVEACVIERADAVGASWRERYESLRLNNDRWSARLPRSIPRRTGRWPEREEFVAYLDRYAERHALDIRFGTEVRRLDRDADGWRLQTSTGPLVARFVIVCTGHDRLPELPAWPGMRSFAGTLLHAAEFQDAADFRGEDVLVVGIGTSATEIATRLPGGGAERVRVAVRTPPNLMPAEFLGVPIPLIARVFERAPASLVDRLARLVAWLTIGDLGKVGLAPAPYGVATELAVKGMGPVIDRGFIDALKTGEVELVAPLAGFDGTEVELADGARIDPKVVIAATGYRSGLEELVGHLGVLAQSGEPAVLGARTHPAAPGLYFNGYWLPLSGELSGMRRDSRRIARAIAREA